MEDQEERSRRKIEIVGGPYHSNDKFFNMDPRLCTKINAPKEEYPDGRRCWCSGHEGKDIDFLSDMAKKGFALYVEIGIIPRNLGQ